MPPKSYSSCYFDTGNSLVRGGNSSDREKLIYKNVIEKESKISMLFEDFLSLFESVNQVIRKYCKDEGVILADLETEIPKEERYIYDYVHYTNEGSRKAAECIFTEIKDSLGCPGCLQ